MENDNLLYVVMKFCMLTKLVMMFPTITFKPDSVPKQLVSFGKRSHKTVSSVPCELAGFDKNKDEIRRVFNS